MTESTSGRMRPIEPTIVTSQAADRWFDLGDMWRFRELTLFLAWRDISVRYKQTALGVAWAVLQPAALVVVFTVAFGVVARVPTEGLPYPVFAYSGLVLWLFFSHALTDASASVVANERLITKVYFPRLIIPFASILTGLADFGVNVVLLGVMIVIVQLAPGPIWFGPFFVVIALVTAAGTGTWLAALNVRYRDVRYTLPLLSQLWLFATPVAYPLTAVPEPWKTVLALNPMTAAIEGFRGAVLGTQMPTLSEVVLSCAAAVALLLSGIAFFRRFERGFADVI